MRTRCYLLCTVWFGGVPHTGWHQSKGRRSASPGWSCDGGTPGIGQPNWSSCCFAAGNGARYGPPRTCLAGRFGSARTGRSATPRQFFFALCEPTARAASAIPERFPRVDQRWAQVEVHQHRRRRFLDKEAVLGARKVDRRLVRVQEPLLPSLHGCLGHSRERLEVHMRSILDHANVCARHYTCPLMGAHGKKKIVHNAYC